MTIATPPAPVNRGVEIHGRDGLHLSDTLLAAPGETSRAAWIAASRAITVQGLHARGQGGAGLVFTDGDNGAAETRLAMAHGCIFEGFDVGVAHHGETNGAVHAANNLFNAVTRSYDNVRGDSPNAP